jgi:phosphomannomutase
MSLWVDSKPAEAPERSRSGPAHGRLGPAAVRAYDIRGVVGPDIHPEGARALGLACADAMRREGLRRVGVGRDGRRTSPVLERALVNGLVEGGLEAVRIGLGPTPMLAFAVGELGLDGAVMVTASHNPPAENGFKLQIAGERVHGRALEALVAAEGRPRPGGAARRARMVDRYVEALAEAAEGLAELHVAWDCGNGATGPVVERLTPRLPGRHRLLHARVDGRFPNHHPDPAVAENLQDLAREVTAHGCDLGLAFDGDGDRIGVVDAQGQVLWADQLLLLLARDLMAERPGATVVADVKCSRVLFDGVEALGGRAVTAPSGYVHVREAMLREDAALAGELSGHVFFAGAWRGVDDALYAALRTLRAVSRLPGGLAGFRAALPRSFATPEMRIPCPEPRKAEVVRATAERMAGQGGVFDPALGLRVLTGDGWWLLRASGTEPKLTCRCEACDPEALERLKATLRFQLELSGLSMTG